ncbi:pancreatic alpha-amylase-like [Acomys russatus]|uniref:pancreatic alpha-amylase-like n=1 Tax=Acomys russatus TaxID=60746 RepID=UPI0021E1CD5C|nr:pancreatic alpha-amylase-like [Acomys russatus]
MIFTNINHFCHNRSEIVICLAFCLVLEKGLCSYHDSDYMNHLIDNRFVAGFRLDAAKHMWPVDIKRALSSTAPASPPNVTLPAALYGQVPCLMPWLALPKPLFRSQIQVGVYVGAVINHMCGGGGGEGKSSTCGSYYNANKRDFPSVPYSAWDFNDAKCDANIGSYQDAYQVRNCHLSGLLHLVLEKDYVHIKIADYMNHLIDIGVAGFRLDAAKHMWPGDIKAILDKLRNLNTKWFSQGSRPFIYQEVIDLSGEAVKSSEHYGNGRVTEFNYGAKLGTVIRQWNGEKMSYLRNWEEGWDMVPSDRAFVFVDNHDNQLGHGAGRASILTFLDARMYKMAVGFMLGYGFTRVMSSYGWQRNFQGGKASLVIVQSVVYSTEESGSVLV